MIRTINIFEEIDWITVGIYFFLVIFGWINIFASNYNEQFHSIFDLRQNYGDQLLWILISFLAVATLFVFDHRFFYFFAYIIYAIAILLLISVVIFGFEVHGAKSWLSIAGFRLQPSEFVKIAVALTIARYLSGYNIKLMTWRSLAIVAGLTGLPVILISLQPDFGTAMVFSCFILVLYREGLPGWILGITMFTAVIFLMTLLLPEITVLIILLASGIVFAGITSQQINHSFYSALIVAGVFGLLKAISLLLPAKPDNYLLLLIASGISAVILVVLILRKKITNALFILFLVFVFIGFTFSVDYVFDKVLKPHQQTRVNILLGKETDIRGVGYNLNQSLIAIGAGGFSGKGFLHGTQTKLDYVPEQSTDFIFCTVGEEWGFIGTFIVVLLFSIMLIRLLFLAERQRSVFARLYGYGVVSILFFHFAINIAMTIGLFPVIGIPLPFFSYGGSSMLAFSLLLFIFIRLDAVRKIYLK
ncbi:MAG: rod shape-determining protein RodA [Bacteroidales bacterium]|nr:rod shape-determining protein RodA [Bacteroidales bacterium]MBN2763689.1 rod shape-determining protein RodA [Bacteroidales bacterium]